MDRTELWRGRCLASSHRFPSNLGVLKLMAKPSPVLIAVDNSPIHGQGAYARRRLPQGTCIGVYEGRHYSAEAFLTVDWSLRPAGLTYLFNLFDGTTIDGAEVGNATRFLNHACEPNCFAQEVIDEHGTLTLQLLTLRTILPGEELFLDYALTIDERETPADYPCRCALLGCRGIMAAV
jgi:SET domain-containing protein